MINFNGAQYSGKTIRIENDKVYIDGKLVEGGKDDKTINILVEGNLESLHVDYATNLIVDGDVGKLSTVSGDVTAGDVKGDITTTSGDIEITGNCGGSINTVSGDVEVTEVAGNIKTLSGDVDKKLRK